MPEEREKSVFETLNDINVTDKVEKKNGLSFLSWPWAWATVKKYYPDATYTVYENERGWNYHTDGNTCWVKTGVTINGLEYIELLPVMNNRNNSIKLAEVTSFDVNKAIQRSLTKAIARHGLGLYIYAGEDLPEKAVQENEEFKELLKKSIKRCSDLIKDGFDRIVILDIVKNHNNGNNDIRKVEDMDSLVKINNDIDNYIASNPKGE